MSEPRDPEEFSEEAMNGEPLRVDDGIPLDSTDYASPIDLFSAVSPKLDELYIPEIKKKVLIRSISGRERDAYEQSLTIGKGANQSINMRNARAKLAVLALANPDGSRMFKDSDVSRIGDLPAIVCERIFDRARKLAGLTNEDMDEITGN